MKKILGIIGSPRKLGNCVTAVKAISRGITVPHELMLLRLYDFNIQPCKGCYQCLFNEKKCIIDDDLEQVISSMEEADAYIVTAPVYFLRLNARLLTLMDRALAFYSHAEKLWGKPSIGVGIAGINGKEGSALLDIQKFQKVLMCRIKDSVILYGALPGEVFLDKSNIERAEKLGARLFEEPGELLPSTCPICGGDTFRFINSETVRCMLCSNEGPFEYREGIPIFNIKEGEHKLFSSKSDALSHEKWLQSMKKRYIENSDNLKSVTMEYIRDGKWIKPAGKD